MADQICFYCFRKKGSHKACPYCGYMQQKETEQAYRLVPGTVLRKRYVIGTGIGIGGFGIIYRAFDVTLRMIVAVKEFYPAGLVNRGEGEIKVGVFSGEKEGEFKRQLARFLEEARNMAVFSKEKDIVNVYDFFEENETAYIIMEYVDAPLLKDRLKKGNMSAEEACQYMHSILEALEKVHRQGIIHKDISPDNIFLTGTDSVKLFDFGAAKFRDSQTERTVSVVVKSGYTPPEQYSGKSEQHLTMDIYAAGAVFYEMVTGEKPVDALERITLDELKSPGDFKVKIDEYLERIILKAMAIEPQMRFASAAQFKKALEIREKVELPEEIIKRHRRLRKVLTALLVVIGLAGTSFVVLSQTVFSGKGKIDIRALETEELSIWLSVKDIEEGKDLKKSLLLSVEKECPQLAVDVQVIEEEGYADRLEQAARQGDLPDVFCTDSVLDRVFSENGDWAGQYCADLSRLFHTMDVSSYMYLEQLEGDGAVYAVPMALQLAIAYVNIEKEDHPEYVEMDSLSGYMSALRFADQEQAFLEFIDQDSPVSWIIGDLSDMEEVEAVTVEHVPSTDFAALPVLKDGKLTGCLRNWYGVKKSGDQNREDAGMVLLSLLLSDGLQSKAYMDNGEGLPLNESVLESYKENKLTTYLSCLNAYELEDVAFLDTYSEGSLYGSIREETGQ